MTIWSKQKKWNESNIFLIMCHWCPSHPYDQIPADNKTFLDLWYILVYPNYLWTWGSDWICNFDNSIESILITIDFIKKWNSIDERSWKQLTWNIKQIILIWASFWWSVVLCAWAKSKHIDKIISCSPVVDWKYHNLNNNESSLEDTALFLGKVYNNLWRCEKEDLKRFSKWKINVNPIEYIEDLKNKKILIIHDKRDPQILLEKIIFFFNKLYNGSNNKILYLQNKNQHILLHHLNQKSIFDKVNNFILDEY